MSNIDTALASVKNEAPMIRFRKYNNEGIKFSENGKRKLSFDFGKEGALTRRRIGRYIFASQYEGKKLVHLYRVDGGPWYIATKKEWMELFSKRIEKEAAKVA